jgi:hypothetical protein
MDEITDYCERFLSADFNEHAEAFRWLRQREPFLRVVDRFRDQEKGIFDVAAMLVNTDHELHRAATYLLERECAKQPLDQDVSAANMPQ